MLSLLLPNWRLPDAFVKDLAAREMTALPRLSGLRRPAVHFTYLLRRAEQYATTEAVFGRLMSRYYRSAARRYGMRYGIVIPPGVCGPGLFIVHPGGVIISGGARIGANLRIHAGVNIGEDRRGTPKLGDDVYLGPGAKLFGDIQIGDNVQIGANAVVNRSIPANTVVVGPYASILRSTGRDSTPDSETSRSQDVSQATLSGSEFALSSNENEAVTGILNRELGSSDELDFPLEETSVDSFTLMSLRAVVEIELGVSIPDIQWSRIRRLRDIALLPAVAEGWRAKNSAGEPTPPTQAEVRIDTKPPRTVTHNSASATYAIGMPQMALSGLGESWIFKELGDVHWAMITSFLQTPSSEIVDDLSDRLYATFARVRLEANPNLGGFNESAHLNLNSKLTRFGANIFFSHHKLESGGASITGRAMSSFAKYGETGKNTSLIKGSPTIPHPEALPSEASLPELGVEYQAKRNIHTEENIFESDYDVLAPHDINGVGLIYFAAYPTIFDICLSQFEEPGFLISHSISMRDVFYFANAEPTDRLKFVLHSRFSEGGSICHRASIFRSSDNKRMAYIESERVSV